MATIILIIAFVLVYKVATAETNFPRAYHYNGNPDDETGLTFKRVFYGDEWKSVPVNEEEK